MKPVIYFKHLDTYRDIGRKFLRELSLEYQSKIQYGTCHPLFFCARFHILPVSTLYVNKFVVGLGGVLYDYIRQLIKHNMFRLDGHQTVNVHSQIC